MQLSEKIQTLQGGERWMVPGALLLLMYFTLLALLTWLKLLVICHFLLQ